MAQEEPESYPDCQCGNCYAETDEDHDRLYRELHTDLISLRLPNVRLTRRAKSGWCQAAGWNYYGEIS